MAEHLEQQLQKLAGRLVAVDPSRFGDPVALKTDWAPARDGGTVADTLVEVSAGRLEFRASLRTQLFALAFLVAGAGVMIGVPYYRLSHGGQLFNKDTAMPMLIGLAFAFAGSFLLRLCRVRVVLDKRAGVFWKGRKSPDEAVGAEPPKGCGKLEEIHALQLVSEYCCGPKTPAHYRYHLNLVREDGSRITVVVHGDKARIREMAGTLSKFLDKPVWDAL